MIASNPGEMMQSGLITQSIFDLLRLPRVKRILLALADEHGNLDFINEILNSILLDLGE